MSVRLDDDLIRLEGDCHVEDAEALVRLVQDAAPRAVDLSDCRHLHGAVAQAILSLRLPVTGTPADPFLRDLLAVNFICHLAQTA